MEHLGRRSLHKSAHLAVAAAVAATLLVLLFLSGVPNPPTVVVATSYPTVPPTNRIICNNLKAGDTLKIGVRSTPGAGYWLLASVGGGPSYIGPYLTDLSSNWFVLQDLVFLAGGAVTEALFPVPSDLGLIGVDFTAQAAFYSPFLPVITLSPSLKLRVSGQPFPGPKNVLIIKQTTVVSGMTTAAAQADTLALGLGVFSHQVIVVDDVLPADLLDYDVVLDCRFTTPPSTIEADRFLKFLQQNGGLFFVCGPYAGSTQGQLRAAWIANFLTTTLGLPITVSSGGNLSGAYSEVISPSADPNFLFGPATLGGVAYEVTNEGGNFGPPGAASVGSPFVIGTSYLGPMTYGMFFRGDESTTQYVGGTTAVLFSGSSEALISTPANPNTALVFENLLYYLDR